MRSALALALASLTLAGCLGGTDPVADPASAGSPGNGSVVIDESRPDPSFSDVQAGIAAAPDAEATLEEAPEWRIGEWWRIQFRSPLTGEEVEFVRVVAGKSEDGGWIVGMPHEGWYKEAVVYHAPCFGDVDANLGCLTHNIPFAPLQFPLTDDATWTTQFSGGPEMTATVATDATEKTAKITFTGGGGGGLLGLGLTGGGGAGPILELTYDAKVHEVVSFRHNTVEYDVVEHGYDFQGWITIPRAEDLVFFHGRIGPAIDLDLAPAGPIESVEISGGFNRVTFIQVTQSLTGAGAGAVIERATSPAGNVFETQSLPGEGFKIQFFEETNPDGAWSLEHVVAGEGFAFIEGIAYHQYDIRLPDGIKRSDHSHEVIR